MFGCTLSSILSLGFEITLLWPFDSEFLVKKQSVWFLVVVHSILAPNLVHRLDGE